jgi:hypothetical protein
LEKKRPATAGRFRITYSQVLLVLSGMLLMFLIQHVILQRPRAASAVARKGEHLKPAGRWGQLDYVPLALQRPDNYFTNAITRAETVWTFRGYSEADLDKLFASLELEAETKSYLADRSHWRRMATGFRIAPPPKVVVGIKPGSRAKLYDVLARDPENVTVRMPFYFRGDGFDEWFANSGLSAEKLELVRKLSYRRDNLICFADAAAFSQLATPEESMCLVKSLWRVSTFVLQLRLSPDTDIDAVLNYWAKGGRAHVYKPLMQSLSRIDEGALDVASFFPPFARLRLFTFPQPDNPNAIREDCFWSSMNFFSTQPDDRFFNPDETKKALKNDYVEITKGEREFGDTLLLLSKSGQALHMCVYIADDVVFTKNGFNQAQPWVLMKLDEMLGWYEHDKPFDVLTFRRKSVPGYEPVTLSQIRRS